MRAYSRFISKGSRELLLATPEVDMAMILYRPEKTKNKLIVQLIES